MDNSFSYKAYMCNQNIHAVKQSLKNYLHVQYNEGGDAVMWNLKITCEVQKSLS